MRSLFLCALLLFVPTAVTYGQLSEDRPRPDGEDRLAPGDRLRPGDPDAADEVARQDDGLVPAPTPAAAGDRDADSAISPADEAAIAALLRTQETRSRDTLVPVPPKVRRTETAPTNDHWSNHVFYIPGTPEEGLLKDTGILGSSDLAAELDAIDAPVRELEASMAAGIDRGLIGGDARKRDVSDAMTEIRPVDPLLEAVLTDPVLMGAQPRIDRMVVEPDATDAPLRFSDVDTSLGASLAALGDHRGAQRILERAVRVNIEDLGLHHERTQAALRCLVELYQSWAAEDPEKSDEAARYRALLDK